MSLLLGVYIVSGSAMARPWGGTERLAYESLISGRKTSRQGPAYPRPGCCGFRCSIRQCWNVGPYRSRRLPPLFLNATDLLAQHPRPLLQRVGTRPRCPGTGHALLPFKQSHPSALAPALLRPLPATQDTPGRGPRSLHLLHGLLGLRRGDHGLSVLTSPPGKFLAQCVEFGPCLQCWRYRPVTRVLIGPNPEHRNIGPYPAVNFSNDHAEQPVPL